jgi:hypothetical protein
MWRQNGAQQVCCYLSLTFDFLRVCKLLKLVELTGIEPVTS